MAKALTQPDLLFHSIQSFSQNLHSYLKYYHLTNIYLKLFQIYLKLFQTNEKQKKIPKILQNILSN